METNRAAAAERRFVPAPELGYPSVLPAFGIAAEADGAEPAALWTGDFNSAVSSPWYAAAAAAEQGEPSVFPSYAGVGSAASTAESFAAHALAAQYVYEYPYPGYEYDAAAAAEVVWLAPQAPLLPAYEYDAAVAAEVEWPAQQAPLLPAYEYNTAAAAEVQWRAPQAPLPAYEYNTAAAAEVQWRAPQAPLLPAYEYDAAAAAEVEWPVQQAPLLPAYEYDTAAAAEWLAPQAPLLPAYEYDAAEAAVEWLAPQAPLLPAYEYDAAAAAEVEWPAQQAPLLSAYEYDAAEAAMEWLAPPLLPAYEYDAAAAAEVEWPVQQAPLLPAYEYDAAAAAEVEWPAQQAPLLPANEYDNAAAAVEWLAPQAPLLPAYEYDAAAAAEVEWPAQQAPLLPANEYDTAAAAVEWFAPLLPAYEYDAAAAAEAEWPAQQAPLLGDYTCVGYATAAVESSSTDAHAVLPKQGERSFPPACPHAETVGEVPAALRMDGTINRYAASVSYPGYDAEVESSVAHANAALLEHGVRSVFQPAFGTNAEAEGAVAPAVPMGGFDSCPGPSFSRPTPFLFPGHDRVEAYDGENEELDQFDTLLLPDQPLLLQQDFGDAEATAARPVVQVEQLGPNDLQNCLRQGESDRALEILDRMVQKGKALNRAVDIGANERDVIRAHPELVVSLRGHSYISIRKQGNTLRAESYYRKHIRGVYPDGVSTGNPFVDTLLAQLEIARTGGQPSDNHDFGDTNETHRCVNDYLKVYFPEFRNEVEEGRTRLGLFGEKEKEGKWVRCLACHKEFKGYNRAKLRYHQLRDARGKQVLCQASTAYIQEQILEAE